MTRRDWHILLIGGGTGCGKTHLSLQLAKHFDVRVLEGDVLRRVVESAVPRGSDPDLHLLKELDIWERPWQEILDLSMRLSKRLCQVTEVVLARHHYINSPVVLEGFWITPDFAAQGAYDGIEMPDEVHSLFIYEPDVDALKARLYARDGERGFPSDQPQRLAMFYEHGLMMKQRADALGLPVLESRPFDTLFERALAALE